MNELCFLTASELAGLIQQRKVSSLEVVQACLEQIAAHNPALNAIVTLDEEGALRRAKEADEALARDECWGPLHGVPVTIKDVFETAGLRTTASFKPLEHYIPSQDAVVVSRLRQAGAIILGKTNTPELAGDEQTDSPLFGRTNNPWNLERIPGGSSGGSAAAVAAGLSPLDIGSDIGGSVRNPAHFCGIYSFKPSDGLVPWSGHIPPPPGSKGRGLLRQFLTPGPLARSLADLRLALTIIAGPDERQWEVPPVRLEPAPPKTLRELRIAWCEDFGFPVAEEIKQALAALAGELEKAGCRVERRLPQDFDFTEALRIYNLLKEAALNVHHSPLGLPRFAWRAASRVVHRSSPYLSGFLAGVGATLQEYARALSERDGFISKMESFLQDWDAWLCPVAAVPAYPHLPSRNPLEQLRATVTVDGKPVPYLQATGFYTGIFNLTGNPAVVLPLGRSREGLPFGLQVVGQRWQDLPLLSVAETLGEMAGQYQRPPL